MTDSRLPAILAVLGTLLVAAPAAAAPTTIDTLARESSVDAGQGAVAWSRYDDTVKGYRLVVRRNGVNAVPPIATSPVPFDADLGSDASGRPAVVYSRCASYKDDRGPRDRCDLYLLTLATGTERKIAAASSTAASESLPTLWRGELAWIAERKGRAQVIYHRSLAAPSRRRSKRVPGLPARVCNIHNSKPCPRVADSGIYEIELHGDKLAQIVAYDTADRESRGESTEIRLASVRSGKARRIAFQNIGENNQLYTGLSFSSRKLAWFRGCYENPGCAGSGAYRYGVSTHRYDRALEPRLYDGWASTGSATYTSQDGSSPAAPCLIERNADPAWKRVAARNVL